MSTNRKFKVFVEDPICSGSLKFCVDEYLDLGNVENTDHRNGGIDDKQCYCDYNDCACPNNYTNDDDDELLSDLPGKGLISYSKRLGKFSEFRGKNIDLRSVPVSRVIPKDKPENHKLSFIDDPPYSRTGYKYKSDSGCCCMCDLRMKITRNLEDYQSKLESLNGFDEVTYCRANLPKWVRPGDRPLCPSKMSW